MQSAFRIVPGKCGKRGKLLHFPTYGIENFFEISLKKWNPFWLATVSVRRFMPKQQFLQGRASIMMPPHRRPRQLVECRHARDAGAQQFRGDSFSCEGVESGERDALQQVPMRLQQCSDARSIAATRRRQSSPIT